MTDTPVAAHGDEAVEAAALFGRQAGPVEPHRRQHCRRAQRFELCPERLDNRRRNGT